MTDITIRPVDSGERDGWEELFKAYGEFYKVVVPQEAYEAAWNWIHDSDEAFWCDVAVDDANQLIGFTQYQLMHRSLSGGKVCYLSDLYVKPGIRGSGIGKKLIDHVFTFAKSNSISNVRWLTQDFNYKARSVYDSYGSKSDFILYSFAVD